MRERDEEEAPDGSPRKRTRVVGNDENGASSTHRQETKTPLSRVKIPSHDITIGAPRTLVELDLMMASGAIREKPNWQTKIMDQDIRDTWAREMEVWLLFEGKDNFSMTSSLVTAPKGFHGLCDE